MTVLLGERRIANAYLGERPLKSIWLGTRRVWSRPEEHDIRYISYVQLSSGAHIDTGLCADADTRIDLDCSVQNAASGDIVNLFGDISDNTRALSIAVRFASGSGVNCRFGNITAQNPAVLAYGTRYIFTTDRNSLRIAKQASGSTVTPAAFGYTGSFTSAGTMLLGVCRTASGYSAYTGTVRLYGCVIRRGGTEIARLRPAIADGSVCMWDEVRGQAYGNIGGGTFTAGVLSLTHGGEDGGEIEIGGEEEMAEE